MSKSDEATILAADTISVNGKVRRITSRVSEFVTPTALSSSRSDRAVDWLVRSRFLYERIDIVRVWSTIASVLSSAAVETLLATFVRKLLP